jgi:hypothetical protein
LATAELDFGRSSLGASATVSRTVLPRDFDTIALSEYRIAASGNVNGSCNISPALSITVTLYEPVAGASEPRPASNAFSLMRVLAASRSTNR